MTIGRRDFLLGSGGAAVGVLGHRYLVGEPEGTANVIPALVNELGLMSFAQSGEDIIVGFLLDYLGVQDVSYLDIGAYDPILINNTYYFYKKGHRGVLVEPNVTMCEKLESIRPEDTTLAVGIGVDAVTDAEYYVMSEPSWSTFSRAEAEHQEQITNGEVSIKEVRTLPLLNINNVMDEHFGGAPTFLSIDAEGWHIAILKSVDYDRFRPKAICIETLVSGASNTIPEIPVFMETKGYIARGGSFVNTIFVDSGII